MKNLVLTAVIGLLISFCPVQAFSQGGNGGNNPQGGNNAQGQLFDKHVYVKIHNVERKPITYPQLREADVMWMKQIWRVIDLQEKMNLPLYYPIQPVGDRKSLAQTLYDGIAGKGNDGIIAFDPINDDFASPITKEEVDANMGNKLVAIPAKEDPATGEIIPADTVPSGIKPAEVLAFEVKEEWFFDKQRSTMEVRILGLCPYREFRKDPAVLDFTRAKVFYVYFPQVRRILAQQEVYNTHNDAQRNTMEDIFLKRQFGSYIIKESNPYENRSIDAYKVGQDAQLEAERIKNEVLFRFEHDLWQY